LALPSAWSQTLGKPTFAECHVGSTRQTVSRAPHTPAHARYNGAAVILCRVPHSVHSAKTITCAAHDRYPVATLLPRMLHCARTVTVMICRVPDWGHSAKLSVPSARCPSLGKALWMSSAIGLALGIETLCQVPTLALSGITKKILHCNPHFFLSYYTIQNTAY